jgi:hypothetical protein
MRTGTFKSSICIDGHTIQVTVTWKGHLDSEGGEEPWLRRNFDTAYPIAVVAESCDPEMKQLAEDLAFDDDAINDKCLQEYRDAKA